MAEVVEAAACAAGGVGLVIIDMINDMAFEGSEALAGQVEATAEAILRLRAAADRAGAPTVYVNDNYGQWRSERSRIVEHCRQAGPLARRVTDRIAPREDDYFVIKPHVSGFYATNLPAVLPRLGVSRLVLTGIATDVCVLFTAADAHMRDYDLWVPRDATASSKGEHAEWALEIMRKSLGAETAATDALDFAAWVARARREPSRPGPAFQGVARKPP